MKRIGFATAALMLCSGAVSAETREHGAFTAARIPAGGGGLECKFQIGQARDGQVFQATLEQAPGMMFTAIYVSSLKELRGQAVSLQIDGREWMRFDPPTGRPGAAIIGVHAEPNDERMQRDLNEAAGKAHAFEIVAGHFRWSVPVEGLKQAVDDYWACRHDRWT